MIKRAWFFCVLALRAMADPNQPPANPAASPAARAELTFIQGLAARPDKRVLSGQFTDGGDNASGSAAMLERIQQRSGCTPAILGVDYANWWNGRIAVAAPNAAAVQHWGHGGLVAIEVHCADPCRTNRSPSAAGATRTWT